MKNTQNFVKWICSSFIVWAVCCCMPRIYGQTPVLSGTANGPTQITLSWPRITANVPEDAQIRIEKHDNLTGFLPIASINQTAASTQSYQDNNASSDAGNTYRIWYYARQNEFGKRTVYSNQVTITTPPLPPNIPTDLDVFYITGRGVTVAWTGNNGDGTSFILERSDNNGPYNMVATVAYNRTLSYIDNGVSSGNKYCYRVKARNSGGDSGYSNVRCVTISQSTPSAPSGLLASVVSPSQINLSWTDNANNESGFEIERSQDGTNFSKIGDAGANATSFQSTGLSPNSRYWYRVRAKNSGGNSGYSNIAEATTQQNTPSAPSGLIAKSLDPTFQIQLNWIDGSNNETGFIVERGTDGLNFSQIVTLGANVTQYVNTGLPASTRYFYRVRAFNGAGSSGYTNVADATTNASPPTAPGNLSAATASEKQINLNWLDNSGSESGFEVERSQDGINFSKIADLGANTITYASTGLSPNTQYWYRVRAKNNGGYSGYSNIANAITRDLVPNTPKSLSVTPVSNTQITLNWIDNSGNETGFEVERSQDGNNFSKIADVAANATTYLNTGLATLTRYWYRVRAKNAIGNSGYSNVADATTLDVPPVAPSGLSAVTVSSSQINLTWKDNSGNESGFEIERSTDGKNFVKTGDAAANAVAFQQSGLTPATRYWFRVRSRNSQGGSSYSNIADATTRDVPPANPAGLSATAISYQQINLKWTDQSGNETGFEIERSTDGKTFQKIVSVGANTTSYVNVGLTELTQYYYRVRAVNAIGSSGYSEIASARTPKAPLPDQPKNLTAVPIDFDLIQLKWSPVSANTTAVVIERSQYPDREFREIGRQQAPVTQFPDREILPVQDYYYRIKATNPAGSSPYSNVAKISAGDIITGLESANPARMVYASGNKLYVRLTSGGIADLALFDMRGIKRLEFSTGDRSETPLPGLEPGIYFVTLRTSQQLSRHKILVK